MKDLNQLLKSVVDHTEFTDTQISEIFLDSRQVTSGACFMAYPGSQTDGRDYIDAAVKAGASTILYESEGFKKPTHDGVQFIGVKNLSEQVSLIAGNFYDHPSQKLDCIAVTGTNGKTSITQFMAQALSNLGKSVAVMGTMGVGKFDNLTTVNLTTVDPIALQKHLANFVAQGIEYVALEASSHALDQDRLRAVELNSAHFTNLTHDHLDYHQTMDSYGEAKAKLFAQSFLDQAIFNFDDEYGQVLYHRFKQNPGYCYSLHDSRADFYVTKHRLHASGITAEVKTPDSYLEIEMNLLGEFNLSNVLAVVAELYIRRFSRTEIERAVKKLTCIDGRMQVIKADKHPAVIIDYAHTPDALKSALQAMSMHSEGRIWCVFGCGGNRDIEKRKLMGQVAEKYADIIVLCDDNPRNERSDDIIDDILTGIENTEHVHVQPKRDQAITYALNHADFNDSILIAGKGHEDYQIYGNTRLIFSDIAFVKALLEVE